MDEVRNIVFLMPRSLDMQAGGMTRLVSYTKREVEAKRRPFDFEFIPTRLSDRPPWNHLSAIVAFWRLIRALVHGAGLVHINVAPKGSTWRKSVFAWVAHRFGAPVVLHLHGAGYDEYFAAKRPLAQRLIRSFFRAAEAVIVLGEGWRDWAISPKGLGLDPDKVHIIDNGVPDPNLRAPLANPVPRIVFVGLVGHRKGVDTLLDALKRLPTQADWTCAICGNGDVATYEALARRMGFDPERVSFTGWQDEAQVRAQMARSDIFVLPSRAENQPVAILEAMAIGLPVVATAVGDIPNQVIDGATGRVVPRGDPDALAEALGALVADPTLRRKMATAGRARFETTYSSAINLEKTLAVYRRILG
ncbi:MAG: glycosyltransferase family 4 protein [Rhodobacteraceae bacterium]|nr:glycosyltransferase family 4 protein [Paracoccaceae bacterium]